MALNSDDVKSILAGISGERSAQRLAFVVAIKKPSPDITRYFFAIKIGGHDKSALVVKYVLNWLGNIASGGAGAGTTGLGALGSGIATAGGKGGSLKGLGGAMNEGTIASFSDTGNVEANCNALFQLEAAGGIQGFGFLDLIEPPDWEAEIGLWIRATGESGWSGWLSWMSANNGGGDLSYSARGSIYPDAKTILMRGVSEGRKVTYR